MFVRWTGKPGIVGLSALLMLAAAMAAPMAGCGNQPTQDSDMNVVVPEPGVNVSSKATPASTSPGGAAGAAAAPTTGAAAAPAAAGVAGGWGTLKGQVIFEGTPPSVTVLRDKGKAEKNPEVCAADGPILSERLIVDPATKGVKNALVYLPRPTAVNEDARKAFAARKFEFDQKKCIFEPHVLGLMTGVQIVLKSSDPASHNLNVKLRETKFNRAIGGGQTIDFTPNGAEKMPGQVVCDIHPWMTAWWMVLDNPYLAVTDEKGNFEIKNVPSGAQKVVVWQESVQGSGFVTPPSGEEVVIKANDATVKDFKIDAGKLLPAN